MPEDEEPKKEEEPVDDGDSSSSPAEVANRAADRLEAANKEHKALLSKQELANAEARLAGKARAGQVPEKPPEETDAAYADRIMSGDY